MSVNRIPNSTAHPTVARTRFQVSWKSAVVGSGFDASSVAMLVSCDTQGIGAQPKAP